MKINVRQLINILSELDPLTNVEFDNVRLLIPKYDFTDVDDDDS